MTQLFPPPAPRGAPRTLAGLFEQGEWWKPANGTWIKIEDMTPGHRHNTAAMLMNKADALAFNVSMAGVWRFAGAPDDVIEEWIREDKERMDNPKEWMRSTVLYRTLTASLRVDANVDDIR